jgi:citrate lyase beta subunit
MQWLRTRDGIARTDFLVCLRINPASTVFGLRDLLALVELAQAGHAPDAVMLPKVEAASDVELVARHLRATGAAGLNVGLVALIESALGVENAAAIARATPQLKSLAFGAVDLSADLGSDASWDAMLVHRATVVRAAAAVGLGVLDVPWLAIDDLAGLQAECERVRALGYTGKLAIHPKHADTIARAFTPTTAEIEYAQGVLDAYHAAKGGVCTFRGKMLDEPVVRSARKVLARKPA